jgi:hypothetical protein
VKAGYVIDLSEDPGPAPAMRVVSRINAPANAAFLFSG